VTNDTGAVAERIRQFAKDYNAAARVFGDLQKFDPASGAAGALIGDSLVRGLESQLRRDITGALPLTAPGSYSSLASLGIRTDSGGQLVIDESKLSAALEADIDGVAALFGAETGIAARAHAQLESALSSDGSLSSRTDALNRQAREIGLEREAVDRRMETVEARYQAQFSALDRLLAQLQSTSSFLPQQLSSLQSLQSPRE
jgi:flagellar hook-associated protein 2